MMAFRVQRLSGIACWLLILTISDCTSATYEDKRFQQIMQGGSGSSAFNSNWPDGKLLQSSTEKIDVRAEIAKLNKTYLHESSWPNITLKLGAVSAVSFDRAGNVVIFHRADHVWNYATFDVENVYRPRNKGPIRQSTVIALDRHSGEMVYNWGRDLFYMPHGLTIDREDNVWLTDVGLHQVFKFGPRGSNGRPLLTLGTAFKPGVGNQTFCKPTAVAVLDNGDFFVADGYCNARIIKYASNGTKLLSWGCRSFAGTSHGIALPYYFAIPHALTLARDKELLCVADRENGRVQCFRFDGTFHSQFHSAIIGDRLFSVDYTPIEGGQLVVVNGPIVGDGNSVQQKNEVRGYVVSMRSGQVVATFAPNDVQPQNPHDVAVTADGNEIYVADLNPMRVYKFVHKSVASRPTIALSSVKATATATAAAAATAMIPTATISATSSLTHIDDHVDATKAPGRHPAGTAILVASLMLLFTLFTFLMALLVAHWRKRGCRPLGSRSRHHAWDFPSKPEGFKLGGLLKDNKRRRGFTKLDQNSSDDEAERTTAILSSAQFA